MFFHRFNGHFIAILILSRPFPRPGRRSSEKTRSFVESETVRRIAALFQERNTARRQAKRAGRHDTTTGRRRLQGAVSASFIGGGCIRKVIILAFIAGGVHRARLAAKLHAARRAPTAGTAVRARLRVYFTTPLIWVADGL